MRAPKKVIAAMAMATLIGTGVGQAFADGDFKASTGDAVNGQKPLQETEKIQEVSDPSSEAIDKDLLKSVGEIEVTGKFFRKVNNFPEATKAGRYLRVTMPLTLDYTYNLETGVMKSAEGEISNSSVLAEEGKLGGIDETPQQVKMSFVDFITKSQRDNMEYVVATTPDTNKVQLPFELVITTNAGEKVKNIPLAAMKDSKYKESITIKPGTDLDIKIGKIGSEEVTNPELITDESVSTVHNIKLQFEYDGK